MEKYRKLRKRKIKRVVIDFDGETIEFYIRSLTAKEWVEIAVCSYVEEQISPESMARFVAYSITDEQGTPLFASEEGVVEVSEWPYAIVKTLFDEVQKLNGFFNQS